ncbi:MAG: putative signal transducing protein [Sphingomicrobium sp.]|nr:DUF2007 domain-containing protein [Sphingomonadales bacterium]
MSLVVVGNYRNSLLAGIVAAHLRSEGIDAEVFDLNMSWDGAGGVIPVRVMVKKGEVDRAAALLDAAERR